MSNWGVMSVRTGIPTDDLSIDNNSLIGLSPFTRYIASKVPSAREVLRKAFPH